MYNKNWAVNQNTSTSNVDWSALADTWMQQREQQQQVQWQQPPLPPPPPPPQFLLNGPPIPPPGPPPIGMSFPPLPPTQMNMIPYHHQLQVGSNTTQESLTMTNIENSHWRPPVPPLPPPPPSFVMSNTPQWRPNTNHQNQPIFPIQTEIAPSFGGRNFWPPGNPGQQAPPTPVPPPIPPPVPPHLSPMPPQFPTSSFQHPSVDKRMMNTSFNTSIPSLMDLPTSYASNTAPPPVPIPPVSILPNESTSRTIPDIPSSGNTNAKRRKIPAWLRDALGQMEKEKEKKTQNTSSLSNNNNNTSLSLNDTSSKFDDDDDEEDDDDNEQNAHLTNEASTVFNDDDEDQDQEEDQNEDNEDEDSSSALISSTPIVNRRSRFDDDGSTDQQLNVSAIAKRTHSPSPPASSTTATTTLIEDDSIAKEEQFMMKLRRTLTELLLEVTNEELALLAKEVYVDCKTESSTPVIRKASGLTSLVQSFSGSDSDDEEKHVQSIINTTVISKTPNLTPVKQNTVVNKSTKSPNKTIDENKDGKSNKSKTKKSTRDRSRSTSRDSKDKKHHQKKHRRHSSSSSSSSSPSNTSQSYSHKKKKSSNHHEHSDHRKYDDRRRRH